LVVRSQPNALRHIFEHEKIATVGPIALAHLSISVSTTGGEVEPVLMATGLSSIEENGDQSHFTWLEQEIKRSDSVRIVPSNEKKPSEATRIRNLRRGVKAFREDRFCDFCKQSEDVVGPVVQSGETPFICVHCAELCIEIVNGKGDDET